MNILDIIKKKRDGGELSEDEIRYFVSGVSDDSIADYQISALLMAIFIRKMTASETFILTHAMSHSGDILDTSVIDGVTGDKHSTGGVGDKTTLITAPIAAALGCKIAKMSGRGLGHTGGTIDKLESIPNFNTDISPENLLRQVNEIGICIAGQSGNLVPADKKMYHLRDVTATTDDISLIASSVMSKKIASGAECIVLDVKYGSGAFMKTPEDAAQLAKEMVEIGKSAGRKVTALITNMNVPLGKAIGNALEVIEAVKILKNEDDGSPESLKLKSLSVELAAEIARMCHDDFNDGEARGIEYWREKAEETIADGSAYQMFRQVVEAQNGDVSFIDDTAKFAAATYIHEVKSTQDGYISSCDAETIGRTAVLLGAGRTKKTDKIDYAAGIIMCKSASGEYVRAGDVIAQLHTSHLAAIDEAEAMYLSAVEFSAAPPTEQELIFGRIS